MLFIYHFDPEFGSVRSGSEMGANISDVINKGVYLSVLISYELFDRVSGPLFNGIVVLVFVKRKQMLQGENFREGG